MTPISLLAGAIAVLASAAALAYLFTPYKALNGWPGGLGGAAGCVMVALCGILALVRAQTVTGTIPLIRYPVLVTPLNAVWLITIGICGGFISLYTIHWQRHQSVKNHGLLINLLLVAAVCAVSAANFGALVVMCEIMALSAVFLTGSSESGKLWFAMGRLGTLLLAMAGLLLWQRYHTLDFMALRGQTPASDIWLLGVCGFGLLAGIIPLHAWVPQAHADAPAPAAALFSVLVMKVGLFGILSLSLLGGQPPLWWGVALLVFGCLTAFVGGLYALMEHNIQRLLAYHTLENIGIILLGLGAGLCGLALRQPVLTALGLTGGLYHLVNHSLFKSTLFLGAGALWYGTGFRDIEKLGGIGKTMPVISLSMLVGLMAMAALPPLNGFAGEWIIYQSFFRLSSSGEFLLQLLGPLLAVALALTGALAVMCMAKVYGVTFLGAPRTAQAALPQSVPWLMKACVAALALCCVVGGVAAPWLMPLLASAVPLALQTANTVVSPPMIALLLIATPLLPLLLLWLFKGDRLPARRRGSAWVCGYDHEASMVITAHGFAMPVKAAFAPVLKLRKWLEPEWRIPGWRAHVAPVLLRRLAQIELAVLVVVVISRGA